jgi:hypothetical protein
MPHHRGFDSLEGGRKSFPSFRTDPSNPSNPHSRLIFPHSLRFTLRYGTPVLSSAMKSKNPARLPTLRDLRVRRVPRSDRGVKLSARVSSFALLTLFQKQYRVLYSPFLFTLENLTPSFSVASFHSFTLYFILKPVSPLFEHSHEKYPGYPVARHKIGTIVPIAADE